MRNMTRVLALLAFVACVMATLALPPAPVTVKAFNAPAADTPLAPVADIPTILPETVAAAQGPPARQSADYLILTNYYTPPDLMKTRGGHPDIRAEGRL